MEKQNFDFEAFKKQAASRLKKGDTLLGKDGVLTPLLKEFLEGALNAELEAYIEDDGEANRKNGRAVNRLKHRLGRWILTRQEIETVHLNLSCA